MTDNVYLNRDRSAVVPKGSAEAKWQVSRSEAAKLGLLESDEKPIQQRRSAFDATKAVNPSLNGTPQRRRSKRK
jgi:hypothetical protein